jgi:hypothetical protein
MSGPIFLAKGCAKGEKATVEFSALAFVLANVNLGLLGSSPSRAVPSLVEVDETKKEGDAISHFFLSEVHKRNPEIFAMAPVGYPEWSPDLPVGRITDEWLEANITDDWLLHTGFLRIDGRSVSNTDVTAKFKSAFICLNESRENSGEGSRLIVFNAFEDGFAVDMNERLHDPENCRNVVQTGPRIVEYRAKRGILSSTHRQRYLVLAQGDGREGYRGEEEFLGYLIFFPKGATLLEIQDLLLAPHSFSKFDERMRVAVVLTSNNFSNVSMMNEDGVPDLWYPVDRPHPVFLTVKPVDAN